MFRRTAVITAAICGVIASGITAGQASASTFSSATCGSACDGKDPATYLVVAPGGPSNYYYCTDDAKTVKHLDATGGHPYIELRYSPKCATAWARVPATTGSTYEIQVRSYHEDGSWRRTESTTSGNSSRWTDMVNDQGLLADACVFVPYGDWACTGKY